MTRNQVLSTLRERMWRKRFAGGGSLPWKVFTGNPVQFNAPKAHTLRSTSVSFTPVQDLHGYDSPWPAGGGVNKMPPPSSISAPTGITAVNKDGIITLNGTISDSTITVAVDVPAVTFASAGQKLCLTNTLTNATIRFYYQGSQIDYFSLTTQNRIVSESQLSVLQGKTIDQYRLQINPQTLTNATVGVMLMDSSVAETSFAPYSNECPISGWNSLDIYNEPDYDPTAQPMTTLSFPSTVYGGTAEVAEDGTGAGRKTWQDPPIDLGTFTWRKSSSGAGRFYCSETSSSLPYRFSDITLMMCSEYAFDGANRGSQYYGANGTIRYYYKSEETQPVRELYICDETKADMTAEQFTQAMSGVMLSYELDESAVTTFAVTASSTPTAVQGINTIWSDANGDVTVEAKAEAVNLSASQSLNMLLGGRYVNNHTEEDLTDEEALDIILNGGNR